MLAKLEPHKMLLLKAADLIEEHGHCKQLLKDEKGAHCANGALNVVAGCSMPAHHYPYEFSPEYCAAVFELAQSLGHDVAAYKQWPIEWELAHANQRIAEFNNAPATTKEMAVDALRKAAYTPVR